MNRIEIDNAEHASPPNSGNALFELIARSSDLNDDLPIAATLEFMRCIINQFRQQFALEERILYQSKYRRISDHVVQHWKFIQRLSAMTKAYERGNRGVTLEFREYVREWLSEHVSVDDQEFSNFLRDRAH